MLAPTSGTVTGDGEIGAALRLGNRPDFYTTFDLAQIKVWSLLCDTALMSQPSRLVRLSVQWTDTLRFLGRHLAAMTEHGVHRLRCQFVAARTNDQLERPSPIATTSTSAHPRYWRFRAEEVLSIAEDLTKAETADDYERIAKLIEQQRERERK